MFILYDPQTGKICRASGQDIDTYPEHLTKLEIDYEGRPDLQLIKLDLETKQIVSVDNVNEITCPAARSPAPPAAAHCRSGVPSRARPRRNRRRS